MNPRISTSATTRRPRLGWLVAAAALMLGLATPRSEPSPQVSPGSGGSGRGPARQVTLFGIVATPGGTELDPKLDKLAPQLRKLLPDHSFKLLGHESKRLSVGQTVSCRLSNGFVAETELVDVLDDQGKVQLRFELDKNGQAEYATVVTTPPNQLFFCEKKLAGGDRLLMGVGAR